MKDSIDEIINTMNKGRARDRVDYTDISCCSLSLYGMSKESAYYLTKCKGLIADSVLKTQSKIFFASDKAKDITSKLKYILLVTSSTKKKSADTTEPFDWKSAEVEALTAEELEHMGITLLRSASLKAEVDPKEINDLIKMLDNVGALPKKQASEKDVKQVIINNLYNDTCPHCGRECTTHANDKSI